MAKSISHTAHGDAPLSAAKNPDLSELTDDDKNFELVGRTITINRPRQEVYAFWRDFRNLARFMHNIESITVSDPVRSHWVVSAPAGQTVEWDSVILEDEPGVGIVWSSTPDSQIRHTGEVLFRDSPVGRGTEVTASILYDPPAGAVGKLVAKLFQKEPNIQTRQDLRRFKQLMETGEISTADSPAAAPRA